MSNSARCYSWTGCHSNNRCLVPGRLSIRQRIPRSDVRPGISFDNCCLCSIRIDNTTCKGGLRIMECPTCGGSGTVIDQRECSCCDGTGGSMGNPDPDDNWVCECCNGAGYFTSVFTCETCGGSGEV